MLYIVAVLFLLGLFLLLQGTRQQKATGLPGGKIIYADTNKWTPVEKPLYDSRIGLAGKPDYLVKHSDEVIPVEVKTNKISQTPFDSHIYQLAAYCRLVETAYNVRPTYGILHYPNRTFRIDYTKDLENEMLDTLYEMRSQANRKNVQRSHNAPQRCAKCGYSPDCDQRLN
jgi:CRISPR-associated exonuclease Cas4